MPQSRKSQVSLQDTPYYHCISRCVRKAYLCGHDRETGQSYEHRRKWVEDKLKSLPSIFAINLCAYAIMHNHCHIVLHIDNKQSLNWDTREVIRRWHSLFKGTTLTQKYLNNSPMSVAELDSVKDTAEVYRKRLTCLSWFMRVLNEFIARKANKEDECTGRFWEGRFKSQALLDNSALIACMAYVDLNPIRAGIANTLNNSEYTSIKSRIYNNCKINSPKHLMPFKETEIKSKREILNFTLTEYLEVIRFTMLRTKTSKPIPSILTLIPQNVFNKLSINATNWLILTTKFERCFKGPAGKEGSLTKLANSLCRLRRSNVVISKKLFSSI